MLLAAMLLAIGMSGGPAAAAVAAGQANATVAAADADYTVTDLSSGESTSGTAQKASGLDAAVPATADSLSCWDAYLYGSTFAVSCSGNHFYVFVDCANGYRYIYGPLGGSYRVTMTCPNNYRALRGGAYGS
ncbi:MULTISPECIES: hypothetical protein [unclassified Kitasatospora]|uniref:hypothetical protein n=1 Tax=unclassified Kitasatospora TaxID=2633591 RepID=UPI0024764529|nr:hypothetical protein [Kitasatospora sp. GAS204B]